MFLLQSQQRKLIKMVLKENQNPENDQETRWERECVCVFLHTRTQRDEAVEGKEGAHGRYESPLWGL